MSNEKLNADFVSDIAFAGTREWWNDKKPVNQICSSHPFLKWLIKNKKTFTAGDSINGNVKAGRTSGAQWYRCADWVTYKATNDFGEYEYPWSNIHDGFEICEDKLKANGYLINDNTMQRATKRDAGGARLFAMLEEKRDDLKEGAQEFLDLEMHRDGTQHPKAVNGLDGLISLTPETGIAGNIDRADNVFWRNHYYAKLASADLATEMDNLWTVLRRCGTTSGVKIFAGKGFINAYRDACTSKAGGDVHIALNSGSKDGYELAYGKSMFEGIKIEHDTVFEELDDLDAPAVKWTNRCYFLNEKHINMFVMSGYDWIARTPPRPSNKYVWQFAITWTGALVVNRMNSHAVLAIA